MKLYNTASRSIENFKPLNPLNVTFYSCGPTVYDYPHIGNWYTFVRYDMLYRTLKASKYNVRWVMNITDVGHLVSDADEGEDKLEKGAKREGGTAWDIAQKYIDYFLTGMKKLNISTPYKLPKATDHISEQIELIKKLEKRGYTYVIDDGVYFDTSTFSDYGKMARLNLYNLNNNARVAINKQKRQSSDFALWKFSPKTAKRDMEWDSPWGKGFPGWHIECSAMAMKYLGETLDIHAGGIDHIPIHHTNEIAQSEAATGKPFVRYWVHMNFILVNDKKMSKSAGTFITLDDIEQKGFSPAALRLMVLQSHYRTEAHFSWSNLEATQNRLKRWQAAADLRWQLPESTTLSVENLLGQLQNDLDTPQVLSRIDEYFNKVEANYMHPNNQVLQFIHKVLGINLFRDDIPLKLKQLLHWRQQARDKHDWATADKLREQLQKKGIEVRDTPIGQLWSRA